MVKLISVPRSLRSMKKYYDKLNNRLVFVGKSATADYWDKHWLEDSVKEDKSKIKVFNRFVARITKKYLPQDSRILEGGCGWAQNVYTLSRLGYNIYGLDYAQETVSRINKAMPDLQVIEGDVRKLPFEDNFFDGYWSLGVIEHFYDGYDDIMSEMYRKIRVGGKLFITVPSMSPLRTIKAKLGCYEKFSGEISPEESFYQFALSEKSVIDNFESNGFSLCKKSKLDGIKGLKGELAIMRCPLQWCYDSPAYLAKIIRRMFDLLLRNLSGHMTLFVFEKV